VTRRPWILVGLLLASGLAALPASGQVFRYMAFGDSITKGRFEFDPTGQGGYPGRLDDLIDCPANNCVVINEGKDGEKTSQGVSRIETLLDSDDWDVVLLMEGTNDVFNNISNNTIEANLTLMDTKARNRGVDTVHASIIHLDPDSTGGMNGNMVAAVADLRGRIQALAATRNRYFADPWTPLCPSQSCFNTHYHNPPGAVGHPDPSGFDVLAGVFADSIDSKPTPAMVTAVQPTGTIEDTSPDFVWNKETPDDANWYQMRLLDASQAILHDDWSQEVGVCSGSQCTVNLGTFPEGDYTWEVRGRNPRGRSFWRSTSFTIQTLQPPGLPTLREPIGYTGDVEPTFVWQREGELTATTYRLEVSDIGGIIFNQLIPVAGNCAFDTCTADPFAGSPLTAGTHSWRVQGQNGAGAGPFTSPGAFEVEPNLIFWDDFESGGTGAWDTVVP